MGWGMRNDETGIMRLGMRNDEKGKSRNAREEKKDLPNFEYFDWFTYDIQVKPNGRLHNGKKKTIDESLLILVLSLVCREM